MQLLCSFIPTNDNSCKFDFMRSVSCWLPICSLAWCVVVIPAIDMFSFGPSKTQQLITPSGFTLCQKHISIGFQVCFLFGYKICVFYACEYNIINPQWCQTWGCNMCILVDILAVNLKTNLFYWIWMKI